MDAPCPAAATSSMALVLGNLDLLSDILIRVSSQTCLVRAALACKTWLRVASDREFLRRFRELHPPRVLGISASLRSFYPTRLIPVPQPPELAGAARLAARTYHNICGGVHMPLTSVLADQTYPNIWDEVHLPLTPELAAAAAAAETRTDSPRWKWTALKYLIREGQCIDYCNGRLLVKLQDAYAENPKHRRLCKHSYGVCSLGHEDKIIILPERPPLSYSIASWARGKESLLLMEDDGEDAASCLYVNNGGYNKVVFSILRSGVWGVYRSAVMELGWNSVGRGQTLLSCGKLYITNISADNYRSYINGIFALDLATATFANIQLPDGAQGCASPGSLRLSRARQSGLYLICSSEFQLRVWHGHGAGQWSLKHTISVREACAHLNVQAWVVEEYDAYYSDDDELPVQIVGVGENAEFVILDLVASRITCCMQLSNRVVEKVAERLVLGHGIPITMVWPPYFPVPPALDQ